MKPGNSANLSIVIATPDHYDTIRKTINCLRKQTVQHQLEVVIVAPSAEDLHLEEAELAGFFGFSVVEVGAIKSIASANAAGIRKATASIVALGEDHAFPDRNWAEALIDAHRGDWAAVGPVVRNENPGSAISCTDFLIGYGVWQEGSSRGVVQHLPGHNSSYKRSVLIDYGADLETMLEAESVLHWDLNRRGYRLYLEPRAQDIAFELWRDFFLVTGSVSQRADVRGDSVSEVVQSQEVTLYVFGAADSCNSILPNLPANVSASAQAAASRSTHAHSGAVGKRVG